MACADENTVMRFVEGLLEPQQADQLLEHAARCEQCRWLLSAMGRVEASQSLDATTNRHFEPRQRSRVGTVLNDTYRLEALIGRGAAGEVYRALHLHLGRRVAIKLLLAVHAVDERTLARFRREATVSARLRHPHIVEVEDFNYTSDAAPFLVMELLEGDDLSTRLKRDGPYHELGSVRAIIQQASQALQAAHDAGVIHRDMKPTNVFLCNTGDQQPWVKLLDFGISKVRDSESALTHTETLLGTPRYMAPEQAMGGARDVDHRADVYSLGAILYEMLVGQAPFSRGALHGVLYRVIHEDPPAPSTLGNVPRSIERVVLKALAKSPTERFSSVLAFDAALAAAVEKHNRKPNRSHPADDKPRRRYLLVSLLLSAAAGIAALSLLPLITRPSAHPPHAAEATTPRPAPTSRNRSALGQGETHTRGRAALNGASGRPIKNREQRRSSATQQRARRMARLSVQTHGPDGAHVWADVYVDRRKVGYSPLHLPAVRPGWHRVEVRRSGFVADSQRVRLRPGKLSRLRFALKRSPAAADAKKPTTSRPDD